MCKVIRTGCVTRMLDSDVMVMKCVGTLRHCARVGEGMRLGGATTLIFKQIDQLLLDSSNISKS